MNILAYIPARGGSLGIENKNMAMLTKKPLIYYTLNMVKKIKKSVYPFISTDSKKIKKYCEKAGFKNDYMRPKKLSNNNSTIFSGINHALCWLKENKKKTFDAVLLLQPTSPLRELKELKLAINQFKKRNMESLISVTRMTEHPYECIKYNKKKWNYLATNPKEKGSGRQTYKKNFYFIDGSFYIAKTKFLIKNKSFLNKKFTKIFVQKRKWAVDINDPDDLLIAETFLNNKKGA